MRSTRLTVVLIHMRQATLAPMAQAPAIPPRNALLDALSKISRNVNSFSFVAVAMVAEKMDSRSQQCSSWQYVLVFDQQDTHCSSRTFSTLGFVERRL